MDDSNILSIPQFSSQIEIETDDCKQIIEDQIEQPTTTNLTKKRSWIWKYFKPVSLGRAKCHTCSQIYSFAAGTTSNLFRHLKIKHKRGLKEYEKEMDKKRSELWKHFTHVEDKKDKVQCDYCQQVISIAGGSRGNMTRHLKKKHPGVNLEDSKLSRRSNNPKKLKKPVEDDSPHIQMPYIETIEETPEELELVIETKSGIVMNYKTTRRKLNFDLENKLLKNVKLKSKNEVLLIQTSDEKLNISLGEYNKNPDENMIQGYQLQSDSHPIQPRNLAELLHSHSLREEQDVEVVIDNGVPAEQEYCSTSYENCAVHGEDHLES